MMFVYLPIAKLSVNIIYMLGIGLINGFFSGIFGVGGGFITIPLMIFLGIPSAIVVANSSSSMIAASFYSSTYHYIQKTIDFRVLFFLICGVVSGCLIGYKLFDLLLIRGLMDVVIPIVYVVFLGFIGSFMLADSIKLVYYGDAKKNITNAKESKLYNFFSKLPFKFHSQKSNVEISLLVPSFCGFIAGMLMLIAGVATNFIIIPAALYLMQMPASIAIGTAIANGCFAVIIVTIAHATQNYTVDVVLSMLIVIGSIFGSMIGSKIRLKLATEHLRLLLSVIMVGLVLKLIISLSIAPKSTYSVGDALFK